MGMAKQHALDCQELEYIAAELLARVGAVEICDRHGVCSRIKDEEYLAIACKLGIYEVSQGKIHLSRACRRDFTDAIIKVFEEAGLQCNECQNEALG